MVEPLKSRTMTLGELQLKTLDLCKKVRKQLNRKAHEPGLSDAEFLDQVVEPLKTIIEQDRYVIQRAEKNKKTQDQQT
jgi:hypothetical protein